MEVLEFTRALKNGETHVQVAETPEGIYFRTRAEAERYRDEQSLKGNCAFGPGDAWSADPARKDGKPHRRRAQSRLELAADVKK